MITGVNIISGKASVASVNRAGWCGGRSGPLSGGFRKIFSLRQFLGSKEHLHWLKKALNAAKITLFNTINA